MQIENLTNENVMDLEKKLKRMQLQNTELGYEVYPMDEKPEEETNDRKIQVLSDKIDSLINKLNHIFDGHVLMDGEFKKITGIIKKRQ